MGSHGPEKRPHTMSTVGKFMCGRCRHYGLCLLGVELAGDAHDALLECVEILPLTLLDALFAPLLVGLAEAMVRG